MASKTGTSEVPGRTLAFPAVDPQRQNQAVPDGNNTSVIANMPNLVHSQEHG